MIDTTKEVQIVYTPRLFIFMGNYCKETYKVKQMETKVLTTYLHGKFLVIQVKMVNSTGWRYL